VPYLDRVLFTTIQAANVICRKLHRHPVPVTKNANLTRSARLAATMKHGPAVVTTGTSKASAKLAMVLLGMIPLPAWVLEKERNRWRSCGNADFFIWGEIMAEMDATAYFERGVGSYEEGNYNQAILDISEAIRLNPHDAEAYYFRCRVYSRSEIREYKKALADIETAVKINPTEVKYRNELKEAKAILGYGFSIKGAIIGGIIGIAISGFLFYFSNPGTIICVLLGILIGGFRRSRKPFFFVILGIISIIKGCLS